MSEKSKTKVKSSIEPYLEHSNIEAHIIADMLRIEQITSELKEFKDATGKRLDKIETWIVTGLAVTVTSLFLLVGNLAVQLL